MNQLNHLKLKSLFKKFDYISSEIEWKEEYVNENTEEFISNTQNIIDSNSELKELQNEKIKSKKVKIVSNDNDDDITTIIIEKDPELKKLYRKIVKKTHPDKIDSKYLNNQYLKVIEMYDRNDLLNVYRICNELNIEFEIEIDEDTILEEIEKLESRIKFIENSYIYRWSNNKNKYVRDKIMLEYIKQEII
tara:strand:- start:103754 stop:104326 length:573 start_codon:yes stop_codon:yes gene_type:complete